MESERAFLGASPLRQSNRLGPAAEPLVSFDLACARSLLRRRLAAPRGLRPPPETPAAPEQTAPENPSRARPPPLPCSRAGAARALWRPSVASRPSIFQYLERKPLLELHSCRSQKCANGFRRTALPADHLAKIFRMYAKFENSHLRALDGPHLNTFRMVHQGSGDGFNQLLHQASESADLPIKGQGA